VSSEALSHSSEGIVDLNAWNSQMAEKVGAPVYGVIGTPFELFSNVMIHAMNSGNQFVATVEVSMADVDVPVAL
jgi:hypothetical protein